jgi:2-iminobutanoate/2-iminopropanoate deaminase
LKLVLAEAGLTLANVVKTNVFLADMQLFSKMNAVYAAYFVEHKPARNTVAVKGLPSQALVEIECIAELDETKYHI